MTAHSTSELQANVDSRRAALDAQWGPWVPRTTAQLLDVATQTWPDRPFVITDTGVLTYQQVCERSRQLAAGLWVAGVRPGDHVAVDLANLPDTVALKFAVARIGAVSVSINFMLRQQELGYVLRQSRARVLITMDRYRDLDYLTCLDALAPGWERSGGGDTLLDLRHVFVVPVSGTAIRGSSIDDLVALGRDLPRAVIDRLTAEADPHGPSDLLYTSGTTGAAKGVLLEHDAVCRTAYSSAYTRAFTDAYRILFALPMYHVFGYVEAMLGVVFAGGAIVPHASFDAERTLRDIGAHNVDELMCVPAMTSVVLDAAESAPDSYDLSSLRVMFSSGTAHAPTMWQRMRDALGVTSIFTAYGQTETTASTTCTMPGDPDSRLKSTNGCHKPAGVAGDPGLSGHLALYKVLDGATGRPMPPGTTGELLVRGPIVTRGYFDKPTETEELFTADGWMRTGDLGQLDEAGYLTLTGRKKESYRCGGELVLPSEVETVLNEHPSVRASHVVGLPHERMGEVGCVWVVAEGEPPVPEELIAWCSERLARFKVPAHVLFMDTAELPLTVTGRVQKFQLIDRAVSRLAERQALVAQ